jgi:hypothetical protein
VCRHEQLSQRAGALGADKRLLAVQLEQAQAQQAALSTALEEATAQTKCGA